MLWIIGAVLLSRLFFIFVDKTYDMIEAKTNAITPNDAVMNAAIEAAGEKAKQLGQELNCNVFPLVFLDTENNEVVTGFIKEPPRFVKLRLMDKYMTNQFSAGSDIVDGYLIKEHSDPRIYSEKSEHDAFYLGAVMAANDTVKMVVNQFKKK